MRTSGGLGGPYPDQLKGDFSLIALRPTHIASVAKYARHQIAARRISCASMIVNQQLQTFLRFLMANNGSAQLSSSLNPARRIQHVSLFQLSSALRLRVNCISSISRTSTTSPFASCCFLQALSLPRSPPWTSGSFSAHRQCVFS